MKAYRFRLATVARIRALEERAAADRFTIARRELRRAREGERAARAALAALPAPSGVRTISSLRWTADQAERLSDSVRRHGELVAAAASACAEARREWSEAARRSEVLQRLDAQAFARWQGDAMRQESAELDDLSHARRGLAGAER
jgi:flagellar export protein FliJ